VADVQVAGDRDKGGQREPSAHRRHQLSFWTLRVRTRSRAIVIISQRPEGYPHPGRSTRDGSDRMQSVTKQTQVP